MISKLQTDHKVVGVKQTRKAILRGVAGLVFLALDADPAMTEPVRDLCREYDVPLYEVSRMRELGAACGIALDCAAAAVVTE